MSFSTIEAVLKLAMLNSFQSALISMTGRSDKPLRFPEGATAEEAVRRHWATAITPNLLAIADQWGLEGLPDPKRVSQVEQWVRSLADQAWLAPLLLTLALTLLMHEITSPGIGIPGFLSLLCISLFFWMRFLDGTVEWLEITLFIGGLLALGLEMFVVPGFGIFGFGGLVMLATGIVLASQTFIVPSNEYQWGKLAFNTGQIAIACLGLLATVYLLRNQLEYLPFFRILKLEPPPAETSTDATEELAYLVGMSGLTTSRCAPLGKALIDNKYWDVQSHDDLLEPDSPIEVVEVQDRAIFVRRIAAQDERRY